MRPGLLPALSALAALPLAAWEAPTQNALAALFGEVPQTTILQSNLPQVPPREEAQRAGYRYELERNAMKRALLVRTSMAKAARGRILPATNSATAHLARREGAPEAFCSLLEKLARGNLSRRQEYAAEQALRQLLEETYAIDTLQMRLLSETLELPAREHLVYMLQFPTGGMFDMVSAQPPNQDQVLADIMEMTRVLRQENEILKQVHDLRSADAAALQLQKLLSTLHHLQLSAPQK
jgi:uncharacterized protein with von Willebrand factor type A (vWA) domain